MAESKPISNKEIIERIRERWPLMEAADQRNRIDALRDMRFLNIKGAQWEDVPGAKERGDRPKYEFNESKVKAKRLINEMRANRPMGKVRAVEDGDVATAEVMEGLMRNVWISSKGDHITDYAAEYQVGAGMGAWRITTDYASDDVFDQDIKFEPIMNPFCLWCDPAAKDQLKRDAMDWFYTERISKAAYEARWPNAEVVSLDDGAQFDQDDAWRDDSEVRMGEYWWKQKAKKRIFLLQSGKVVDASNFDGRGPVADPMVKEREFDCWEIWMCVVGGGDTILEKPTKWPGKYFPFIVVYGEYKIIEGRVYWWGLTRDLIDPQQGFNSAMTSIVETINQSPQSKFWATATNAKDHLDKWAQAHKENFPFLLYTPDKETGGAPPQRMGTPDVPVALIQLAQMMRDNLKAVSGIFDASIGQVSNETSGRAINARQQQGEIANFHFQDNMALAIQYAWEIGMDLVPKVYDGARSIRILGSDLAEKYVKINQPGADGQVQHDLTQGKYDLTVTVGPSWSTRRQEAAEMYGQMIQGNPQLLTVAGDLFFKATDLPYADEIAERMKLMLPPAIQEKLAEGKELPPEVQQAMAQVKQAMEQVERQGMLVQQAAAELESNKTDAQKAQMGVQSKLDQLKVEQAHFEANVAKQMAALMQREASIKLLEGQLEMKATEMEAGQEQDQFKSAANEAVTAIQQLAQEFSASASAVMQAMAEKEAQLSSRIDQEIGMLMQMPTPGQGASTEAPLQ
jgi:hypothetical protein